MKKVYLWGWSSNDAVQVLKTLQSDKLVDYVVAPESVDKLVDTLIHKPKLIDLEPISFDYRLQSELSSSQTIFFRMYSRVRSSQGRSYSDLQQLFWFYVGFWVHELEKHRPDVILFSSPPHYGVDFILYKIAKFYGIKVKIVYQSLFANKFFCVDAIEQLGCLTSLPLQQPHKIDIDGFRGKEWFYMKGNSSYTESCWRLFMKQFFVKPFSKKPLLPSVAWTDLHNCLNFKKQSKCLMVNDVDFNKPFVYFPLQLQPEMTTSTLGDIYEDQLSVINSLLSLIPSDWNIYVKENPKQTFRHRSEYFFRRLRSYPQVKYLSPEVNSAKLISHCRFVSVITGTAGWEAILQQKNVLTFGFAWFNGLPGVYRYEDAPELQELIEFNVSEKELQTAVDNLLSKAYNGVIDSNYEQLCPDFLHEKNQTELKLSLLKILELNQLSRAGEEVL